MTRRRLVNWIRRACLPANVVLSAGLAAMLAICTVPLAAQESRRESGRQLVEGLLRILVDSQLDRVRNQDRRPAPAQVPVELTRARETLRLFSQQSGGLVRQLNVRSAPSGQVRRLIGAAMQVNANASRLAALSQRVGAVAELQDGVRSLNRDWRLLSHHLGQVDNLPADCVRAVGTLDELDERLCQLCSVTPQVDYQQFGRVTASIDADLVRLIQDIESELARTAQCARLMVEGGRVLQECRALGVAARRRQPTETLVSQLNVFYPAWRRFSTNVNRVGNRFLERDVRRIDEHVASLHELLWLSQPVDYVRLTHLTEVLSSDVDHLFDAVSLNVLLDLRGSDGVLETASEFYGLCENFSFALESRAPLSEMRDSFQYLVEGWPELARCFRHAEQPEIVRSLSAIEDSFVTLRGALGIAPQVDWHLAAQRTAACERRAAQLREQLHRRVLENARYDRTFRRRTEQYVVGFEQAVDRLHQGLVDRQQRTLEANCARVAEAWTQLDTQCLRKLSARDQRYFTSLQPQLTEDVVRLQAMLRL